MTAQSTQDRHAKRNEKIVSVWLPVGLLSELDSHLAAQVAHVGGARVSRHGWIATVIRRALAAEQTAQAAPKPEVTNGRL